MLAPRQAKRLAECVAGAETKLFSRTANLQSLSDTDLLASLRDSRQSDGTFNSLVPSLKGRLLYHQRTGLAWLFNLSSGSLIFRER